MGLVSGRHLSVDGTEVRADVSMMTKLLKEKSLSEAENLAERFTAMMHGDEDMAKDRAMGDLRALQGVSKFPVRIKCALLAFDALQEAIKETRARE